MVRKRFFVSNAFTRKTPKRSRATPARKKFYKLKVALLMLMVMLFLMTSFVIYNFDERMMPTAIATFNQKIKNKINLLLNSAVEEVLLNSKLNSDDFYVSSLDKDGRISTISLNTVLVNDVCGKIAVSASEKLLKMGTEEIEVPVGSLLGIDAFSGMGPGFPVVITPVGNTTVDYRSNFQSTGINQVNFQVWLIMETGFRIVNPNQEFEIKVNRNITLVNTVFSGKVPENYINAYPQTVHPSVSN